MPQRKSKKQKVEKKNTKVNQNHVINVSKDEEINDDKIEENSKHSPDNSPIELDSPPPSPKPQLKKKKKEENPKNEEIEVEKQNEMKKHEKKEKKQEKKERSKISFSFLPKKRKFDDDISFSSLHSSSIPSPFSPTPNLISIEYSQNFIEIEHKNTHEKNHSKKKSKIDDEITEYLHNLTKKKKINNEDEEIFQFFQKELLSEFSVNQPPSLKSLKPSLQMLLYPSFFTFSNHVERYGYNDENGHKILQAIDTKKILSFFHDTFEDSIQYYYQGKVLLEVIDHRFDLSPPPSFRFFLHPSTESVTRDIVTMATRMKEFPIDKQIEFEKRIIDQMNKPLCLTPSFTVCLLSNLLLYNKSKSNSFNNLQIIPYLKSHSNFTHFPSFDDQNYIQDNNNNNINIKQEIKIEEEEEERSDTSKLENLFFTLPSYITSSSLLSSSLLSHDHHNNSRHPIKSRDQNRSNELIGYLTQKQQIIPGQSFQLSSQYSPTNHYTPSPTSSPSSSSSVLSPPSIPIKINHYDPSSAIELKDRTITFQRIYNTRSKITLEIKKAVNGGYSAVISSSSSTTSSTNLTATINTLDHPPIRVGLKDVNEVNRFIQQLALTLKKEGIAMASDSDNPDRKFQKPPPTSSQPLSSSNSNLPMGTPQNTNLSSSHMANHLNLSSNSLHHLRLSDNNINANANSISPLVNSSSNPLNNVNNNNNNGNNQLGNVLTNNNNNGNMMGNNINLGVNLNISHPSSNLVNNHNNNPNVNMGMNNGNIPGVSVPSNHNLSSSIPMHHHHMNNAMAVNLGGVHHHMGANNVMPPSLPTSMNVNNMVHQMNGNLLGNNQMNNPMMNSMNPQMVNHPMNNNPMNNPMGNINISTHPSPLLLQNPQGMPNDRNRMQFANRGQVQNFDPRVNVYNRPPMGNQNPTGGPSSNIRSLSNFFK